jgi:protein-L-isoaspartate(D-aspartate) O-methyltransferase
MNKAQDMDLIGSLIQQGWLKTPRIINAFKKIKREDFLIEEEKGLSELDEALPIGFGQTISQPLVVAFMLEQLNPKMGNKILDIGSGSGWTSALLAEIVGDQGKVIAIEIVPELKESGERNAAKYFKTIDFICADGSRGYEKEAPFDNILASASAQELPEEWKKQLKVGGKIVAPIKNSIWVFFKKSENEFEKTEYPGFVFVPLINKTK